MVKKEVLFEFEQLEAFCQELGVAAPFDLGNMDTRSTILWQSAKMLSSHGLKSCRIEDILVASNVSRRTFYKYFKNKEDILTELFNLASILVINIILMTMKKAGSPPDKLEKGICVFVDLLLTVGPLGNFLLSESMRPESPLAKKRIELYDQITSTMARVIKDYYHVDLDRMLYQTLIYSVVGTAIHLYQETEMNDGDRLSAKKALMTMASASITQAIAESGQ
jgi:AcrR family transcriptional regulator